MRNCSLLALCLAMLTPTMLFADDNGGGIRVQTIKVSSVSPFLTLKFWDYEAEDGDWVRIVVDGETYREFELKNAPKTVSIPILFSDKDEVLVNVIGTKSGNGPVTYAVQATGLGSSVEVYKNYADVGAGNSYRIVKTKDDIFSVGVAFLRGLLEDDENEQKKEQVAAFFNERLNRLPSSLGLPEITPDMVVIDPSRLDIKDESGKVIDDSKEMAYDVDNNQFIVRSDISAPSVFDRLGDLSCKFFSIFLPTYSNMDRQDSAVMHELAHYAQATLAKRDKEAYHEMNAYDAESSILAEGFAVITSLRYGQEKGGVLNDHWRAVILKPNNQPIEGEPTYLVAAAKYIYQLGEKGAIDKREAREIADEIKEIESDGLWSADGKPVYERVKNISMENLLKGIMKD